MTQTFEIYKISSARECCFIGRPMSSQTFSNECWGALLLVNGAVNDASWNLVVCRALYCGNFSTAKAWGCFLVCVTLSYIVELLRDCEVLVIVSMFVANALELVLIIILCIVFCFGVYKARTKLVMLRSVGQTLCISIQWTIIIG